MQLCSLAGHGAEILSEVFDDVPEGEISENQAILSWTGPDGEIYGTIGAEKFAVAAGKALVFRDSIPEADKGPVLNVSWKDDAPTEGHVIVCWRWTVPVNGKFLSLQFVGQTWDDAAAVFILENGQISVQYGEKDERELLGQYSAGEWRSVKFDFDVKARTFDVYLDDYKVATDLPWQDNGRTIIDLLSIVADFSPNDRNGEPVLAIDDVHVETK